MPGRLLAACLLTAALALTSAATADANLYKQYTCKLPSGAPAATDGWATDDAAGSFVYDDDCSRSIALRTTMDPLVNAGVQRAWTWTAPPGTALHGVEVFRAFSLTPGRADATPTATIVSGANVIESHGGVSTGTRLSWNDPANRLVVARERLGSNLKVTLGCVGSVGGVCPDSGSSEVRAFAATFTLSDASAPTVTNVAGTLADDGEKRGVQSLSIAASDTGSGLYRTITTVDGNVVATGTPSRNGEKCVDADATNDDPYEFQHRVPCPLAIDDIAVPLDTRTLTDGVHLVHVALEDASGNRTSAFGPTMISVRNAAVAETPATPADAGLAPAAPSAPLAASTASGLPVAAVAVPAPVNGTGGGSGARLSVAIVQSDQRVIRVAYGRAVTLSGRLLAPSGAPVAGADVEIQAQPSLRGARMAPLARVRTDAAGGFRYVLGPGPSRMVRLGYRARIGDAAFSHAVDVDVRVGARISLKLSGSQIRNGKTLRYSGRIAGQTSRRPLVQIQVRNDRRWVNVCVVRSRARGAFSCKYRFRRTYRPMTYTFRALVKKQDGLPYETAASPSRRVRVRP